MPSTIVVSPLRPNEKPAFEVANLEILVKDSDWLDTFNRIEVWRSRSTPGGPYEELTAYAWVPARLPKDGGDRPVIVVAGPTVNIVGKTLEFLLKEKDKIPVLFTGVDPLTLSQVAFQIGAQSGGRLTSYVDEDAHLVIETLEPGTGAVLRVLVSDAASILALPLQEPDTLVFGRDARISLVQGSNVYYFSDISGSTEYFYKTRFFNSATGAVSAFSMPFGTGQALGVSPQFLVSGFLDLATSDGKPIVGRRVTLSLNFNGTLVDGKLLAGNALSQHTDILGHVEFNLVRGAKYDLAIAGLNLVKTVIAPTDTSITSFQLVDPDFSEQQDYFRVRTPQIPTLLGNI